MKKLIYVCSMEHSGSTLLDLMLGGHPRFIGLGEIIQVIKPGPMGMGKTRQVVCSCGAVIDECLFWSKVASRLPSGDSLSFEERYRIVLDTFEEVFGHDYIPVDSSKSLTHLQVLKHSLPLDLKVLYIIKDVRNFTISQLDSIKRKQKRHWQNAITRTTLYTFWWWYLENKKMQRVFTEQNMHVLQIGYEELCLYPQQMLQKICDFLEEAPEPSMLALKESGSHVIRGNRMRYQKDKLEIRYDHRWFLRREWSVPSFFFPNIMRYNTQEVYKNNTEAIWKQ